MTLGIELTLSVVLGLALGVWLDKRLHTTPWLTFVGLAYGVGAGFRLLYRAAKRASKEGEDAAEPPVDSASAAPKTDASPPSPSPRDAATPTSSDGSR